MVSGPVDNRPYSKLCLPTTKTPKQDFRYSYSTRLELGRRRQRIFLMAPHTGGEGQHAADVKYVVTAMVGANALLYF